MFRRILAVAGPSAVVLIATVMLRPVDLGYFSFLLVAASLMLGAAGAFLIRPDPEEPAEPETVGWLVVLAIMSAVATVVYWFRVWQYDAWDLVTIPVRLLYILGFWWPGVFLSALAWIFAGGQVYRTVRRYAVVLGVGVLASTAGAASYQIAYSTYFKVHDGQRLELAMERLASKIPGSMAWQHNRGVLTVLVDCDWISEAPPYTVYSSLDHMTGAAIRLLNRADVSEVSVEVSAKGLLLFTGDATDAVPADPAEWIKKLDHSILKDGGRLDRASLEQMAEIVPDDLFTPEDQEAFERVFRCGINGSEVSLTFEPGEPVSVDTISQYAVAYRIADRIVTETATYFPEIETFRVNLAGKERAIPSALVAAKPFYLQAELMPTDRVLGLVIRDRGLGSGALDPAAFNPDVPIEDNQLAMVAVSRSAAKDTSGRLFQVIPMDSANVIVAEAGADGSAQVFVLPKEGVPAGPVTIAPGTEEVVGNQWISNSGLIERSTFRATLASNAPSG